METNSLSHIKESLEWFGIEPDESPWKEGDCAPYVQSEREYLSYAKQLVDNGFAYYCFDTRKELTEANEKWHSNDKPGYCFDTRLEMNNSLVLSDEETNELLKSTEYTIRFKHEPNNIITFNDEIRGNIEYNSNVLIDTILFKSNGLPSYHLANVVDDYLMEITHVFRGEEWIPSTPLHCLLYDAFAWDRPVYGHLPLLLSPDAKKISKRTAHKYGLSVFALDYTSNDGTFIEGFKSLGYEPHAIINFLFLCGFTPKDEKEFMNIDEMIECFDIKRVSKAGAKINKEKLNHINSHYVRNKSNDLTWCELSYEHGVLLPPHIYNGEWYSQQKQDEILEVAKERSVFRKDLIEIVNIFIKEIDTYEPGSEKKLNKDNIKVLELFTYSECDYSDKDMIKQCLYDLAKENDIKFGKLMPGLRVAITAGKSGADLITSMYILGQKESKKRITTMIEYFEPMM